MRRAPSTSPFWHNSNNSAWRSATTLPIPEIAPSAPSKKVAMSDIVKAESIATGRPVALSARRFASKATMSFDQSLTAETWGIAASCASVSGLYPMPEAGGREAGRACREARGHDPRELHHGDTSPVISLAGTTRPDARPMISEWRGAATVRVRVTRVRDGGSGRGPQLSPLTARRRRHEACLSCVPYTKEARYAHALQPRDCRRRAFRPRLVRPSAGRHCRRDDLLPRAR